MIKKLFLTCLCVLSLASCKKDYQKLATEYERSLPDTLEVLSEQINEVDHYIYYKDKGNTELIRYDLDKETTERILPELADGETVYGIYAGEENFTVLKHSSMSSTLLTYNLKTQKFKEIVSFWGNENNDAFVSEGDKTVTGYVGLHGGPTTKYVYDFDGNKISEEEEEDFIGDLDVPSQPIYYQQPVQRQEPLQEFVCKNCGKRIYARSKSEASSKAGSCTYKVHRDDRISTSSGSTYTYTGGSHTWY